MNHDRKFSQNIILNHWLDHVEVNLPRVTIIMLVTSVFSSFSFIFLSNFFSLADFTLFCSSLLYPFSSLVGHVAPCRYFCCCSCRCRYSRRCVLTSAPSPPFNVLWDCILNLRHVLTRMRRRPQHFILFSHLTLLLPYLLLFTSLCVSAPLVDSF